jgi:hypothetical protein
MLSCFTSINSDFDQENFVLLSSFSWSKSELIEVKQDNI